MVNLRLKLVVLCIISILSLQFALNSFAAGDKILCVVGDDLITQKDLDEFLALASLELAAQYPNKKDLEKKIEEIKKDVLNQLIDEKMILQEAKRQKIRVDERLVEDRIEEIISQFPSPQDFEKSLVSEGLTLNDAKKKIRQNLLVMNTIDENVRNKIFVHPKEVTDYYKEHSARFATPESAKVDSIFIEGETNSENVKQKIQLVLSSLKNGEPFSSVAEKYSDGPTLGTVRRGQLRNDIEQAIFSLKPDKVSAPIKTEKGFFIFKLTELIPPQPRPLASVQDEVYRAVFQQKFAANFKGWLQTIKKDVYCLIK